MNTKDLQLSKEEKKESSTLILESTAPKKDFQHTNKLQTVETNTEQKEENPNNELAIIIQTFADKLIDSKLIEWHKVTLLDSRKGYALFFPNDKWEFVNNKFVEIKS